MGAPDILATLAGTGLRLSRDGTGIRVTPRSALTDEARRLILAHKAELLATLRESADFGTAAPRTNVEAMPKRVQPTDADALPDPAAESRRQRVLAMLAANLARRLAVVCDGEGDPVPVAVAIRDKGTCEVLIPAARFDPFALIALVERHGALGDFLAVNSVGT